MYPRRANDKPGAEIIIISIVLFASDHQPRGGERMKWGGFSLFCGGLHRIVIWIRSLMILEFRVSLNNNKSLIKCVDSCASQASSSLMGESLK